MKERRDALKEASVYSTVNFSPSFLQSKITALGNCTKERDPQNF